MKRTILIISLVILLAACGSQRYTTEYYIDSHKPYEEIGYEQLPKSIRTFHDQCHIPNDIKTVYCGQLEHSGKKVYGITFADGGEMLFNKNGKCLLMCNLAHGLPRCWTNQIPIYSVLYKTITKEMAEMTNKQWDVRILEIHPNGYLVKTGVGVDITIFTFDKRGQLKEVLIEI